MKQIISDVYQLRLPLPDDTVDHVNVYVVRMDDGCLLIDTGLDSETCFSSLTGQLEGIGFTVKDIRQIIGTHLHPDHYGMAEKLRKMSQAQIALHSREAELIPAYTDAKNLIRQQLTWLHRNGVPGRVLEQIKHVRTTAPEIIESLLPAEPDSFLRDGTVIQAGKMSFQVILAPGHTPGHICLYEPRLKLLIAGDHIMADTNTYVNLDVMSTANPLREYLDSIAEIAELDVDLVLPGHGRTFTNFSQRIEDTVQSIEQQNAEILTVIQQVAKTGYRVASEISWTWRGLAAKLDDLPPMLHVVSVLKTLAHLELLRSRGEVTNLESNGLTCYQARVRQS